MSSLCPRPIGIIESIALIPVLRGVLTGSRSTTPGAIFSRGIFLPFFIFGLPSKGFPRGSITLPNNSSDTSIANISPVVFRVSPSFMSDASPRSIIEALSSSRFKIVPILPFLKTTFSPITPRDNPDTTITPSVFLRTVPIFCVLASPPKVINFFSSSFIILSLSIIILFYIVLNFIKRISQCKFINNIIICYSHA